MSGYLLDTNVLSEVVKKRPEPSVLARLREVAPGSVFTSVVCVTELRYGARRRPGAEVLWERIAREVLSRVRVLPFGEEKRSGPATVWPISRPRASRSGSRTS